MHMNTHQVQKMPVHTHTRKRECTPPWDARNGKKKAKFANAASHETAKKDGTKVILWNSKSVLFHEFRSFRIPWIRTKVMGYHLSTRILFMRPCEVSKSPNTDTLLFPSKVILEPHLQILREYVRNRRNSP